MSDIPDLLSFAPGATILEAASTTPRRIAGFAAVATLGVLLIWFGFTKPLAVGTKGGMILFGGFCLWLAVRLWDVSRRSLILTPEGLSDSTGRVVVSVADVREVQRSALTVKPSNGFTVVTNKPLPPSWVPGVWWRVGRWIGVGGLLRPGDAKALAEILQALATLRSGR